MAAIEKILIIGAGLSGLTLAYLIRQTHSSAAITVVEASGRLGGRIHTIKGLQDTPMELGATWFSDQHPALLQLSQQLDIDKFPQYDTGKSLFQTKSFEPAQAFEVPATTTPSYRFKGGSEAIITALKNKLPENSVQLNTSIIEIQKTSDKLTAVSDTGQRFEADKICICLPPQVAAAHIKFPKEMPASILDLLSEVQTWMAGSMKVVIEYDQPFWRSRGFSGMLYSHAGIITEMYDHCTAKADKYALTGFLNGGSKTYNTQTRKKYALQQLTELLGPAAATPISFQDKIWDQPEVMATSGPQVFVEAHYNNGHPALQNAYLDNRLLFAGSETATIHPGYMEGAVQAAIRAAKLL